MRRALLLALGLALLAPPAAGKELLPAPAGYVLDQVGWLSVGERQALNERLARHERESSVQVVVALLEGLDGEEPADYSARLAEHWGVGQAQDDNGVLVAAYAQDRQLRIEVGYGLEGAIPDLVATRIVRETLAPAFREGKHALGLALAADQIIAASRGEFEGTGYTRAERGGITPVFALLVFLVMLTFFIAIARLGRGRTISLGHGGSPGRHRGGFGGGSSFGGGGGGFSGFSGGGGSFGGGGGGGSW